MRFLLYSFSLLPFLTIMILMSCGRTSITYHKGDGKDTGIVKIEESFSMIRNSKYDDGEMKELTYYLKDKTNNHKSLLNCEIFLFNNKVSYISIRRHGMNDTDLSYFQLSHAAELKWIRVIINQISQEYDISTLEFIDFFTSEMMDDIFLVKDTETKHLLIDYSKLKETIKESDVFEKLSAILSEHNLRVNDIHFDNPRYVDIETIYHEPTMGNDNVNKSGKKVLDCLIILKVCEAIGGDILP